MRVHHIVRKPAKAIKRRSAFPFPFPFLSRSSLLPLPFLSRLSSTPSSLAPPSFLFLCSLLPLSLFLRPSPLFPLLHARSDQEGHLLFLVASHRVQGGALSQLRGGAISKVNRRRAIL